MATKVVKLYASTNASGAALAQAQVIVGGTITAIEAVAHATTVSTSGSLVFSLSTNPAQQIQTNNAQGELALCAVGVGYATQGGYQMVANTSVAGIAAKCNAGDILYIHAVLTGTLTAGCYFLVYFNV